MAHEWRFLKSWLMADGPHPDFLDEILLAEWECATCGSRARVKDPNWKGMADYDDAGHPCGREPDHDGSECPPGPEDLVRPGPGGEGLMAVCDVMGT